MFVKHLFGISTLLLLLSILPVVRARYDVELAGMIGAGIACFFLFIVIIAMLAFTLSWNSWFPSVQRAKGKVKMPRSYWKKKQEVKSRLLDTSRGSRVTSSTHVENGHVPENSRARDTGIPKEENEKDKASWVRGWTISNRPPSTGYEELALAMDLDEEKEESEYRIETTLEDNTPARNELGRPQTATALVRGSSSRGNGRPDHTKSTPTQTGLSDPGQQQDDSSEFRIVAAVVDDEALDLGPYKTIETQTGGKDGGISEQTVTVRMGEEENVTSFSQFLNSSRVAF